MAIGTLVLEPGINTTLTAAANRKGYSSCQLIRWRERLPEKLGGWAKLSTTLLVGTARAIHTWADLSGNPYLIAGTNERVQLYDGGQIYDITPIRSTDNITVDFSTTNASTAVTVTDAAHGAAATDWVYLSTHVAVGGVVLYGYYQVESVTDVNNYVIRSATAATSTVNHGGVVTSYTTTNTFATVSVTLAAHGLITGSLFVAEVATTVGGITISGTYTVTSVTSPSVFVITHSSVATSNATVSENTGQARLIYLLASGLKSNEYQSGYGIGDYGSGDYGGASALGALNHLRQWFFDQWGAYALGNYTGGPFYVWIPPISTNPRATLVGGSAPVKNTASFVAMPQQIVVALGSETGGVKDPNLVRWSVVADYTNFIAAATNQAGSFRIPTGSGIVGGIQGPQQGLIWTDIDLWSMRYIQPPYVFGFTKIASGCGLIAARAAWASLTDVYWMSYKGFFRLGPGGVEPVECPIWDTIFKNLTSIQLDKIHCGANSDFSEVAYYFPSASGSGECDTYAKMSTKERDSQGRQLWDYGTLSRTAWEDRSIFGPAIGADSSGYLQQHEVSADADGVAMVPFVRTGLLDLTEGQDFIFIDQIEADMKSSVGAVVTVTAYARGTTRGKERSFGPYRVSDDTGYINPRIRGRLISFEIGSGDLGSSWRLGLNRFRYAPDGRGG